ncbi:MAG: hypothetical protein AAB865_02710 [Patescibacteria group bacterium]
MPIWLHIIIILILISFAIAAVSFAPWVPARKKDLKRVVHLANMQPGEVFYDFGCGDGRTVFAIAKETQATAIGVELALPLYLFCRIKKFLTKSRAQFRFGNLFKMSFKDADVIYVFGMPKPLAKRFKEKVETECKPGTRILSYVFEVDGWTHTLKEKPSEDDMVIYYYVLS